MSRTRLAAAIRPWCDECVTDPIDLRVRVQLGSSRQLVRVIAARSGLPGLLVLHGGPGLPNRHLFVGPLRSLSEHFTLILWDQFGTGGSYAPRSEHPLSLDQLVADAAQLSGQVRRRLKLPRLFVLGFSWGTELGIRLVQRRPDLFDGYVGSGQAVDGVRNEQLGYDWALARAKEASDLRGVAELRRVGPPSKGQYRPVFAGLRIQRRVAARHDPTAARGLSASAAATYLSNREYRPRDRWGVLRGAPRSLTTLWPHITQYDFTVDAASLEVPVWFLQGRHDITTPSSLVAEYARVLRAPQVTLVWFEHSGHSVPRSEPARFMTELTEALTPHTSGKQLR